MWNDFKTFVMKGNVVDLAVGVIIGGAFGGIVKSLVDDVIMPPVGLLMGGADFSNLFLVLKAGKEAAVSVAQAKTVGAVTLNYGIFINTTVNFLILAAAIFMMVKVISRLQVKKPAVVPASAIKDCKFCYSPIHLLASRCPHCTSEVPVVAI
ncbi:MAG: large conductance mechanosensitive channel protein MscL [Candidatus Sericytochromatia bacterium]|nr:large conductance mechanosensitive channel protein MscL [Candidatus Sericytochromatia bacterium]